MTTAREIRSSSTPMGCTGPTSSTPALLARSTHDAPVDNVTEPGSTTRRWAASVNAIRVVGTLGHRRIGIVTGPEALACSRDRLDGYRAALARADVEFDPDLVVYGDFRVSGGVAGAELATSLIVRDSTSPPRDSDRD